MIIKCPRCGREKDYVSPKAAIVNDDGCIKCKKISSEFLEEFLLNGFLKSRCQNCNEIHIFSKRNQFLNAIKNKYFCKKCKSKPSKNIPENCINFCPQCGEKRIFNCWQNKLDSERKMSVCKNCSAKNHSKEKNKKWVEIIGYDTYTKQKLNLIRRHWNALNDKEKDYILNKSPKQKRYYWDHLRRMRCISYKRNRKKAFEKYRGKNHWIHRPKTWEKVFDAIKWNDILINVGENFKIRRLREHKITGLNLLKEKFGNIEIDLKKVPSIKYEYKNQLLTYKTGIYLPNENQIVEIKSSGNLYPRWDKYLARWKAYLKDGYSLRIMAYNRKKLISELIIKPFDDFDSVVQPLKDDVRKSAYGWRNHLGPNK